MQEKTISKHISAIKNRWKLNSDDVDFSDEFLYDMLSDARVELLDRKAKSFQKMGNSNWQTICVPLELATYHDCDCIAVGCEVLKSTIDLPSVISYRNKPAMSVTDLAGNTVHRFSMRDKSFMQYSKVLSQGPSWDIINNKLVIFNDLYKEMVLVKGIFNNPFSVSQIETCLSEDGTVPCYDPYTEPFPLEPSFNEAMYKIVSNNLGLSMRVQEDENNNAKQD